MEIISNKRRNIWAMFYIISGILVIYLSCVFVYMLENNWETLALYFFTNSILLLVLGISLRHNKIKLYNILSIILFCSVLIGWFSGSVRTAVYYGFYMVMLGGPIIISLFHIAVISVFISSSRKVYGKIQYEDEIKVI